MDKELIDKVWKYCLPKEFKEEVKRHFFKKNAQSPFSIECDVLCKYFGHHNLTSDAEGEEMLCVPRKKVQEMYAANERIKTDFPDKETGIISDHINHILGHLFGSKCLPEGEPKPAEPKLDRGQKCKIIGGKGTKELIGQIGTLTSFVPEENAWAVKLSDMSFIYLTESDLEPYTEPTDNPIPPNSGELESQEADKHFDSIHKDGFAKERRLNIATQIMSAILSNQRMLNNLASGEVTVEGVVKSIVDATMMYTDALIAKCEKGANNA